MTRPEPEPNQDTPAGARTRRQRARPGVLRRLGRLALFCALLAIVLAEVVYLLRGPLLEGPLRRTLESELGALLDADVEIGSIGGNWLSAIEVDGIRIQGHQGAAIVTVEGGHLRLRTSPWDLVRGDLAGLRALAVDATELHIDPLGRWPGSDDEGGDAASTMEIDPWSWFQQGVEITLDRWALGPPATPDAIRRGTAARLEIAPGRGRRQVWLVDRSGPRSIQAFARGGEDGWRLHARIGAPASLLRASGWDPGVTAGRLEIDAQGSLDGTRLAADLRIESLEAGGRTLSDTRARLRLEDDRLEIRDAAVSLPGIAGAVAHASVPLGSGGPGLLGVQGSFDLRWQDLQAFDEFLPAELAPLRPIMGTARGRVYGGELTVDALEAVGQGLRLSATPYRGPLPQPGADGASAFTAQPWSVDLVWDRSLDLPIETALRLEPGRARLGWQSGVWTAVGETLGLTGVGLEATELAFDASWDGERLRLDGLTAARISPEGAGSAARLEATGELRWVDGRPLDVALDATGTIDSPWWPWFGYAGGATGIAPLAFDLAASSTLDFDAGAERSDRALGPLTAATLRLDLFDVGWQTLPPLDLHLRARLAESRLDLDEFASHGWLETTLRGHATLPADLAQGELEVDGQWSLEELPAAWVPGIAGETPARGAGSFEARGALLAPALHTAGTASSPDPLAAWQAIAGSTADTIWPQRLLGPPPAGALRLDWSLGASLDENGMGLASIDLLTASWGRPGEPARIDVVAHGRGAAAGQAEIDGSAEVTLRAAGPPGQDLPFDLTATLGSDAESVSLEGLTFRTGIGTLEARGRVAAPLPALLGGRDAALEARADWQGLALETLPAEWTGSFPMRGSVDGELSVDGTLSEPALQARVTLRDASAAIPGTGRIAEIGGTVTADASTLRIERLAGTMGEGPVELSGRVEAGGPDWWTSGPEPIRMDLKLTSTEALLVQRTDLRIRASADVRATGTLEDLAIAGNVELTSSRLARRMTLLPDLADLGSLRFGGAGADTRGVVLFSIDPPLGDALHFDVGLHTKNPLEVRTHVADTDANLDLRLAGTGALPYLVGTIQASSGTLRFPGSQMEIESLLVAFREEDPFVPRINAIAAGRRYGYRTELTASGTYDNPEVVLSTQPSLPPADAWTLVTTGLPPTQLQSRDSIGQATLIGGYLIEELAGLYLGGPGLDGDSRSFIERFTFEAGREVGRDGEESVTVEFEVSDRWALQAERDIYGDYNGGVVLRLRFR